ncbi:ketoacyl-ACP synthase III [Serratia proteamaculans]|uniref:Ketoacyl-ACP synthase III n=1 Tax=Serratia proteamaculans TaxID=28151 RepID=A0A7U0N4V2_SERPR|nr:3-oxoacyl-[acyl-carrier-protein] synthase III C-terminal domain-containing protein [Serratia proteamaculans]MBO1504242.1 ketoacyl-ACP synthase III [Serratia proteamaculans]MDW5512318.1 3-oxoacyl-[acyl-carrier-protein] synthase III C-terminal domain-containing protein [Serratia proteamaculans]QQX52559.1 ketoacyl-ACP synthase III [Serratia proteamaculans]CAI1574503.1 3-oxoacyl-[acyl-carrier-protein] synthase 3 [Serratia proteamaculans]
MTTQSCSPALLPLKVIATGAALPPNRVDSSTLDSLLRKPPGYVEKRSGISYRFHAADDASQAELAVAALQDAITRGRLEAQSIDLLISASAISVQALPCTAAHILKVAGLAPGTAGFDINSSCVSFISAMQVAAGLLNAGTYRRIAIVSADLASRGIDWDHEESSLIFGDGAACAIVERGDGTSGILASLVETYPEGSELCEIRAGGTRRNPRAGMNNSDFLFHMQGKKLFRQASALIEDYLDRLLAASGLTLAQIATVVPHQASHLSLEHMRKRLHVSAEVLVDIYRYHGNQVAASIPTALHAAVTSGRFNPGKPVMLIGTAAGLSLAGMVLLP